MFRIGQEVSQYFYIMDTGVKDITLDDFHEAVEKYGVKFDTVTTDPFNEVKHDLHGEQRDMYMARVLGKIRMYAREYNYHHTIIMHIARETGAKVVDDATGRRTFVSAAYNSASSDYPQVAQIAADGIRHMSTWLPGYPFPYPVMTIFNGNDGMEYPMMCNDVSTAPGSPMGLTIHEVSHSYFPFMMGINEQDHAWMDEGWAAFFDFMLTDSLSHHTLGGVRDYSSIAGTDNDVPPMVKSRNLSTAYRNASYQRPQNAYFTLLDLLGYEKFHECMMVYMSRWKGKHPAPFDFFQTWNNVSGQNLDWFWRPWFFEWGYPDLQIQGVINDEASNAATVVIARNGTLPVPIHLEVVFEDGMPWSRIWASKSRVEEVVIMIKVLVNEYGWKSAF